MRLGIRVDGDPVGGHVDHGPLVLSGGGEDLAGATTQDRVAVVGVLPVAVGVADDQFQGPAWAGCGPLEHGQVAVGVPGGHDRALPDVPVNRAGLLRAVVDGPDFGGLDEFGAAAADAELGFPDAADHPVRRQAVASAVQVRMKSVPPPEKIQQEKPLRSSTPSSSTIGWYTVA